MKYKILLVDDEKDIVEFLKYNLEMDDFDVITAFDGYEALTKLSEKPDLVVVDVMMPRMNGYEVCTRIRQDKALEHTPVLFLTAKSSEQDEIIGLGLGADDFISKPISPRKFIARVKANLRKADASSAAGSSIIQHIKSGPLEIDRERFEVKVNGRRIILSKKEFELLVYMASHPGKVLKRESILNTIWGSEVIVMERTVDVHVRKIREKLAEYDYLIETIKGVGYRFRASN